MVLEFKLTCEGSLCWVISYSSPLFPGDRDSGLLGSKLGSPDLAPHSRRGAAGAGSPHRFPQRGYQAAAPLVGPCLDQHHAGANSRKAAVWSLPRSCPGAGCLMVWGWDDVCPSAHIPWSKGFSWARREDLPSFCGSRNKAPEESLMLRAG